MNPFEFDEFIIAYRLGGGGGGGGTVIIENGITCTDDGEGNITITEDNG